MQEGRRKSEGRKDLMELNVVGNVSREVGHYGEVKREREQLRWE